MLSRVRALSTRHSATLTQYEPCNRVRHSPLFLFLFRSWTGYLIDIKRLSRVRFGMRLHELRHDQYTRNRFLDHVYDRRFGLQSTLLGMCFVSSRRRLLRNRPPLLGLLFLPFRFRLDQALRDLPLCGFCSLCDLCTSRCLPCCYAFGPFGHHTLALIERPRGTDCVKYWQTRKQSKPAWKPRSCEPLLPLIPVMPWQVRKPQGGV